MSPATRTHRRHDRPGFTLIEVLVAVSIMAVLMSLAAAAYQRVRLTQMQRAAEDVVSKLQGGVDDQIKVIADEVRRESTTAKSKDFGDLRTYCGDDERAMSLLCYCRIKQNFPESAGEIAAGNFTVGGVTFNYDKAFASLAGMGGTADQQKAAILYVALAHRTLYGKTFASDEATFGAQTALEIGGQKIPAYVDPWGHPILFKRFHSSAELDEPPFSKRGAVNKDPFDPSGKLFGWSATDAGTIGTAFDRRNKTVAVYSVGYQGKAPMPGGDFDEDDVVGYRLRSIGAKGVR